MFVQDTPGLETFGELYEHAMVNSHVYPEVNESPWD